MRSINVDGRRFGWNTMAHAHDERPRGDARSATGGAFFVPGSFNIVRVATDTGKNGSAPGHFFGTTYDATRRGRSSTRRASRSPTRRARSSASRRAVPGRVFGNPNPKAFYSLSNDVRIGRRLTLRAQVDGVAGGDVFNFDRRLLETPAFGSGAEYGRELTGELPRGYFAARRGVFEEYVEDGSFVKLRELSVSYALPTSLLRRARATGATITVAGRNLKTWTDYTGWDPETNVGAQSTLVRGFSFATAPIPRSVTAAVTLTF